MQLGQRIISLWKRRKQAADNIHANSRLKKLSLRDLLRRAIFFNFNVIYL